jgi:hypothetical protein
MKKYPAIDKRCIYSAITLFWFFLLHGRAEANQTFAGLIDNVIIATITPLFTLIISLILLYFFWGVAEFLFGADDQRKIENGKKKIYTSVIALFIGLSVWGIVFLLQVTFNF